MVHKDAIVGMGAIICNGGELAEGSLLAAGSVLPPGKKVPSFALAMGNPARVVKDLDDQMREYNRIAVRVYRDLNDRCLTGLKLIED
jgi:phenylacetic acid degradation protein